MNLFIIILLFFLVGLIGYVYYQSRIQFGPGRTPEETAYILVHDWKFGRRSQQKAIQEGDAILPFLQQETDNFNFAHFGHVLPFIVAEVLGAIKTERSQQLLTELYHRTDRVSRLVGALGLAQQGTFSESIDENNWLVHQIRNQPKQWETALAIRTLGLTKQQGAIRCLLDLLNHTDLNPSLIGDICEALARIGSTDAIPFLKERLINVADGTAFRALITLGESEAVGLAIARINPQKRQSRNMQRLVTELQWVTGKSYGYNQKKWQNWWQKVEETWQIPEAFQQPWDQQRHYQSKMIFSKLEAFLLTLFSLLLKIVKRNNIE